MTRQTGYCLRCPDWKIETKFKKRSAYFMPENRRMMTKKEFEALKKEQMQLLLELEEETKQLTDWIEEFKKVLSSGCSQEEVFTWSKSHDIEDKLHHIELF